MELFGPCTTDRALPKPLSILLNKLPCKNTSSWGKLSLGGVKDPKPWEKLQIGVIGAPLKLGQVRKKHANQTINQSYP